MEELNEEKEIREEEPVQQKEGFLTGLFDLMVVNLLFLFTSLAVITVFDAAASMYSVMLKKERGTCTEIVKTYFSFFLRNFTKSLPYTFLVLITVFGIGSGFMAAGKNGSGIMLAMCMTLSLFAVLIYGWTVPLFAQFDNAFGAMMINSVKLAVENPGESVKMAVCHLILPVLFLVLPGIFFYALFFWMVVGAALTARYICRLVVPVFDGLIEAEKEAASE